MAERKIIPIQSADEAEASNCADAEPFALMVLDDKMEPEFQHGDIIVCEPEGVASHGAFVIVEHDNDYYFRQLEITDEGWFMKALNPVYPTIQITGPAAVKAVVVLKKKPGRRKAQKTYT